MTKTKHTIDATDKAIGRVASAAAVFLMGKDLPTFESNKVPMVEVHIVNASKAKIPLNKLTTKTYKRYSGYPGGLTVQNMATVIEKKGYEELFTHAVYGMLPSNKLRAKMMKNLKVMA
jgi:large subunit ribosomal protein L13